MWLGVVVGDHVGVDVEAAFGEANPDLAGRAVGFVGQDEGGAPRVAHRSNHTWAWPVPATASYSPNGVPTAVQAAPPRAPIMVR